MSKHFELREWCSDFKAKLHPKNPTENGRLFPFLRLPRELRDMIYSYHFETATINLDFVSATGEPSGLSLTCRQIHLESRNFRDHPQYLKIATREIFFICMAVPLQHRSHFVNVRELEITRELAEDILDHYETDGRSYRIFENGRVFLALEVVLWPPNYFKYAIDPRETREGQRNKAVRYCFVNLNLKTVPAPE